MLEEEPRVLEQGPRVLGEEPQVLVGSHLLSIREFCQLVRCDGQIRATYPD